MFDCYVYCKYIIIVLLVIVHYLDCVNDIIHDVDSVVDTELGRLIFITVLFGYNICFC